MLVSTSPQTGTLTTAGPNRRRHRLLLGLCRRKEVELRPTEAAGELICLGFVRALRSW